MDNDKTRFMFHVEHKGYNDTIEYRNYPDVVLTQYASFDSEARWPDVMRAFARFLGNVYGYNIEEQFNEMYVDPLVKWNKEQE